MNIRFITLFILVLETLKIFVFAFPSNETDHQALLFFKASITDDPLGALDSWNNSIHFCQWNGVTCSSKRERVTALDLTSQQLVGTLSSHIGNLSFVRSIYLGDNKFHGSIPNEIGRLFRLQYLYLKYNSFQGRFPTNISHCVDIRNITMSGNHLEGQLPTEFAYWSKLYMFELEENYFTGSIPSSIGNISSLNSLCLSSNHLVGSIPLEVAHHTKLQSLYLGINNLSGTVPPPLYNMSSLYIVELLENGLEGTLPTDLGFTLPKLQEFYIELNRFSGPLPSSITNASNLIIFTISGNKITGPIPMNFGSLPSLEWLGLGNNTLGDNQLPDDWSFFNSLVNCTRLYYLDFSENGLRGEFPNSIVNLSTDMQELYLYRNHIHGSIPREIGKLVNMIVLSLFGNLLTGTIPESIGELSKLAKVSLSYNNISGVIPTSISNVTQLLLLAMASNKLQGTMPSQLYNISTLEKLTLDNNRLTGVIPEDIVFYSHCFILYLSRNLFTGSLPSQIGSLKQLVELDVSDNNLTGNIPASLGGCVMLEYLSMEGNRFQVIGNLELCGGIQALHLRVCPVRVSRNNKRTFVLRKILILVLVPLGIMLACLALICYQRRNSKNLNNPITILKHNQFLKLSYQDLLLATNEFSPTNQIGEGRYGSVYKGVLRSVEHIVAVKVLKVEVCGANKSFLAECNTLRNIRHRNLIKIITACSSTDFKGNDFKALVFEYMTNGSVEDWLHPSPSHKGNERNLTLLQRLNIAIDVALGVDYLHHHSHTNIIHSDIKPSNILLDEEFVAHIGDFGLARFSFATTSDVEQAKIYSTGVCGTVGYVPPEYGMFVEISREGDVYSYGILVLEMFSGKRPIENNILRDGSINLHDYVRKGLPQRVMEIADPCIVLDQEERDSIVSQPSSKATMEECLASIFQVGILCSEESPRKRIDISVAINRLQVTRDKLLQRRQ
ncbi:putative receptor-like protein kinase At3g47110 isoform X2 [Apium graveolens]|uniref:putative receptor-like protein kinase At3g47110 isoform X2 n=1 Tax=Apium graveolens TaxID=4045 RepID=UPI003D7AD004